MAAIRRTTGCSCIPTVTGRSIANRSTWHHRVPHGAFERLERHAGKLARVVRRGLDGSNPVRLPGAYTLREGRFYRYAMHRNSVHQSMSSWGTTRKFLEQHGTGVAHRGQLLQSSIKFAH